MKTHIIILTVATLLVSPLRAAEPLGINALTSNPAQYAGREITVMGHVDRISAARRMVVLIDSSEATCTDGCDRKTLVVEFPAESPLPTKGQTLTVTGKLFTETTPLRLSVTSEN
jgi:hypothetical protein